MSPTQQFYKANTAYKRDQDVPKESELSASDEKKKKQTETPKPFPLLSLPPELWIYISRLAVDHARNSAEDDDSSFEKEELPPPLPQNSQLNASQQARQPQTNPQLPFLPLCPTFDSEQNSLLSQPPLTKTCKLLREELLPYFYSSSSLSAKQGLFNVELKEFHCEWVFQRMGCWLKAIGERNRRGLKGVGVVTSLARGVEVPERPRFAYLGEKENQLGEVWSGVEYKFGEGEIVEDRGEKVVVRHMIVFG